MIAAEELRAVPLFAALPDSELTSIAARAADIHLERGESLLMEGEQAAFYALLTGRLVITKRVGMRDVRLGFHEPGAYFGEVPLLLGSKALASISADVESRVMRLEATDFHDLVVGCARLNAEVMRTMADRLGRVQRLVVDTPASVVTVVGHEGESVCHDVRDFLSRNHVPFTWRDVDEPASTVHQETLPSCDDGPVVRFSDGSELVGPSYRDLADRLDLHTTPDKDSYDVVIVGGGPAGLAAAVYGASEGLCTLLVERMAPGGQAGTSSRIENYLGFPSGLSGDELSELAVRQADRLGAEILVARSVRAIETANGDGRGAVVLEDGTRIGAESIVIATGVAWRHLPVMGFDRLVSRGIYYGAAATERFAIRGKDIFIVGGGNSAGQAALLFAAFARTVTILIRDASLDETMSRYLIEQLRTKPNVQIDARLEVVEARGQDHLEEVVVQHVESDEREVRPAAALFVFIGADAETDWLPGSIVRDERGYICTGRAILDLEDGPGHVWPLERDPYLLETSVPGVFAVGDVRHGSIKRCASAVGEGSMAIAFVYQYLAETPALSHR